MSNINENKTNIDVTANEETLLKNPTVLGDETVISTAEPKKDEDVVALIHYHLNKMFGGGSQLFAMEFPGRVLNRLDYAYPIEDYNSVLTKPYTVAEREFRLSDNLMDMSPMVQGPNGSYLSSVYNTVLNNYTPKITDLKEFIIDKMELRLFLLEKITDEIDGEPITCSRMEFCQRTYMKYLENKYKWDQEKIDKHTECNANGDLEGYAKWLSTTSWTKDHELETLFNDAVVRGFYHEVMTILGFLDISSPAARLTAAKQNKRSSIRRSIDSSRDILPVQFEPSNWFRSLMPNYSPQDLTLDAGYLATEYQAKSALLQSLEAELRVLTTHTIGTDDLAALEESVADLKGKMVEAEKDYFANYTSAQVDMIKLAFEIVSNGDIVSLITGCSKGESDITKLLYNVVHNLNAQTVFGYVPPETNAADSSEDGAGDNNADDSENSDGDSASSEEGGSSDSNGKKDTDPALEAIEKKIENLILQVCALYEAHLEYFEQFDKLMDQKLAIAQAHTSNYDDQIDILIEKIKILKQELSQLSVVMTSDAVNTDTPGGSATTDTDLLPVSRYDEDTSFADIVFSVTDEEMSSMIESDSSYANMSGKIGGFFASASATAEYSASNSTFISNMMSNEITIGMRVTKVTIDRGGWFDPSIFDISGSFMRIDPKIAAGAGLTSKTVVDAFVGGKNTYSNKSGNSVATDLTYKTSDGTKGVYALPAFPTSFIIAKDMVVKFSNVERNEEEYKSFRAASVKAQGHIFGMRMGGGYSSEVSMGFSESSDHKQNFYMRIPGPQILGWFLEMTPEDRSTNYESLSKSEFFNDVMAALKDYREKLNSINSSDTDTDCIIRVQN